MHGLITHGEQFTDPKRRMMPTTYYGETAGIGCAILTLCEIDAARAQRVNLIGMVPVHLLTRKAMALYRRHVTDDGAIAFHITNRYLDLRGVVQQLAEAIGWPALWVSDGPPEYSPLFNSDWVIVSNNPALMRRLAQQGASEIKPARALRPRADDYSNLFDVLR